MVVEWELPYEGQERVEVILTKDLKLGKTYLTPGKGAWNFERGSFYEHVLNEENWNAACISSHRDKDSAQQMIDKLNVKMKEQKYS